MYSAGIGYFADVGKYLGRDAPGLEVAGTIHDFSPKTEFLGDMLPDMCANGMNATILTIKSQSSLSDHNVQSLYILKELFWLCGVYLNFTERVATVVAVSDNKALSLHGLSLMTQKLDLPEGWAIGPEEIPRGCPGILEELLVERAKEMIMTVPKRRNFLLLE